MRITVDIPECEIDDAIRSTGARAEDEAVIRVVMEFNRRSRIAELTRHEGTCVDLISPEELEIERRKG
jgi:hypothetical protein